MLSLSHVCLLSLALVAVGCGDAKPQNARPDPVDAEARAASGEAVRDAKRAVRNGRPREATELLRRAVELDPTVEEAHLLLGQALLHLSDVLVGTRTRDQALVADAVHALTRATELAPEDAEAAFWLGQALAVSEKAEDAIAPLERAVALDPLHGAARKALGIVYADLGHDDEAREQLSKAVELLPDDANAWANYGYQLDLAGELDQALTTYLRSVELDWSVPGTYSRLATLYRRLGNTDGATDAVEGFRAWTEYGKVARERVNAAKAARTDPGTVSALAEILIAADLHERAVAWLERALRAAPDNARMLELIGVVRSGPPPKPEGKRFRLPRGFE